MVPLKLLEFGLLAAIAVLPANAEVNQSWEKLVQTVKVGKSVAVKSMNSIQIEGKLVAITADSITVEYSDQRYVFVREDVLRVRYAKIRRNHALIGMVIGGAAVGTFVGKVAYYGKRQERSGGWGDSRRDCRAGFRRSGGSGATDRSATIRGYPEVKDGLGERPRFTQDSGSSHRNGKTLVSI